MPIDNEDYCKICDDDPNDECVCEDKVNDLCPYATEIDQEERYCDCCPHYREKCADTI